MMERVQDQRPVYMGTFGKYTKSFDYKISVMENDIADLQKRVKLYGNKIQDLKSLVTKTIIAATVITAGLVAIYLTTIF